MLPLCQLFKQYYANKDLDLIRCVEVIYSLLSSSPSSLTVREKKITKYLVAKKFINIILYYKRKRNQSMPCYAFFFIKWIGTSISSMVRPVNFFVYKKAYAQTNRNRFSFCIAPATAELDVSLFCNAHFIYSRSRQRTEVLV